MELIEKISNFKIPNFNSVKTWEKYFILFFFQIFKVWFYLSALPLFWDALFRNNLRFTWKKLIITVMEEVLINSPPNFGTSRKGTSFWFQRYSATTRQWIYCHLQDVISLVIITGIWTLNRETIDGIFNSTSSKFGTFLSVLTILFKLSKLTIVDRFLPILRRCNVKTFHRNFRN